MAGGEAEGGAAEDLEGIAHEVEGFAVGGIAGRAVQEKIEEAVAVGGGLGGGFDEVAAFGIGEVVEGNAGGGGGAAGAAHAGGGEDEFETGAGDGGGTEGEGLVGTRGVAAAEGGIWKSPGEPSAHGGERLAVVVRQVAGSFEEEDGPVGAGEEDFNFGEDHGSGGGDPSRPHHGTGGRTNTG